MNRFLCLLRVTYFLFCLYHIEFLPAIWELITAARGMVQMKRAVEIWTVFQQENHLLKVVEICKTKMPRCDVCSLINVYLCVFVCISVRVR